MKLTLAEKKSLDLLSLELGQGVYSNEKFRKLSIKEQVYVMNNIWRGLKSYWGIIKVLDDSRSGRSS